MAGGDSARLTLDVTNLTDKPQTLNVKIAATGLLTLKSGQPSPVTLEPGVRTTLFVPVSASDGFGDGEVNVTVSG